MTLSVVPNISTTNTFSNRYDLSTMFEQHELQMFYPEYHNMISAFYNNLVNFGLDRAISTGYVFNPWRFYKRWLQDIIIGQFMLLEYIDYDNGIRPDTLDEVYSKLEYYLFDLQYQEEIYTLSDNIINDIRYGLFYREAMIPPDNSHDILQTAISSRESFYILLHTIVTKCIMQYFHLYTRLYIDDWYILKSNNYILQLDKLNITVYNIARFRVGWVFEQPT